MPAENILQTLQKYATVVERLEKVAEDQREFVKTTTARLDRLESLVGDIRERLARLETARSADRAEIQAE